MKIAIICNKSEDQEANAKHSGYHFARGFEQIGDEVDIFSWREQEKIDLGGYDFYFAVDSSESYAVQHNLKPLVVYNGDTHMPGGLQRDELRTNNADIIFNGNIEFGRNLIIDELGRKSYWLPLGYDYRFDNYEKDTKKDIDVSMIGHPNSTERIQLWDMLERRYNAVVGNLDSKEYVDANSRAKIVINQPTEPFDTIYNNRMIEGMACQCLVLQKKLQIKSHKKIFEENKEFIEWEDFVDLKNKIDYYLEHEDERYEIATRAYEKVRNNYSYRDLCKIIKNYVYNILL